MLGLAVDLVRIHGIGTSEFWPIPVFGVLIAVGFFLTGKESESKS